MQRDSRWRSAGRSALRYRQRVNTTRISFLDGAVAIGSFALMTSGRAVARLRSIVGVGPIAADAVVATVGNAREFKQGRQMAAWLGLVPTQHSSGGHARLGGISCRGDAYLRTLLIQGARSSLQRAKAVTIEKATPEQLWIRSLDGRMPFGKIIVAIANKHARQIWTMLAHGVDYDPHALLQHPMQQRQVVQAL